MNALRTAGIFVPCLALFGAAVTGQPAPAVTEPAAEKAAAEPAWAGYASVFTYVVPEQDTYAQPTVTADRGRLHLEARYNYEALETGSVWAGCNFAGGQKLAWEFTPMLGGVFGDLNGVAPGFSGTVRWWQLELYSEGEYVFDLGDSGASFFYSWTELTLAPVEWFRFGLVTQRTRAYESDREIQRGVLAGFSWRRADLTAYVLDFDAEQPTWVFALGLSF